MIRRDDAARDEPTPDVDAISDPRLDERLVRHMSGNVELGSVRLIGVVHDHPSSLFRVARTLRSVDVDVLALELPPLAVPLFAEYAKEGPTPPRFGGEMSLALDSFDGTVVGMDGPTPGYAVSLLRRLVDTDVSIATARKVCRDLVSSSLQAVACRVGAVVTEHTPITPRLYAPVEHETTLLDTPAEQATDELNHLRRRQNLLAAIETPPRIEIVDDTREERMADTLHDLRTAGDVVGIVGMEHLDPVAERLRAAAHGVVRPRTGTTN